MHAYIHYIVYIYIYNKGPSGRILQVVAHVMILGNLWHAAGVSKKIQGVQTMCAIFFRATELPDD